MFGNVMTKSTNARAQRHGSGTLWHNSGETDRNATPPSPSRAAEPLVRLTPTFTPLPAPPPTALHHLCRLFDRVIAASSRVSNEPVLDVRDFGWTATLRGPWSALRDEALGLAAVRATPPDACGLIPLWQDGGGVDGVAATCPRTMEALAAIPDLHDAAIALLAPGAHVLPRRGPTKALITCHLGLVVPRDGGARMRVRDRIVRWAEGQTLVFDDSHDHEAWNEAEAMRVILRVRVARPLRQPGRAVARAVLRLLRRAG